MKRQKEYWKCFKFYKSKYKISNLGRVYSYTYKRFIGYIQQNKNMVTLTYRYNQKAFLVDKLIVKYFKTVKQRSYAYHKDLDTLNDKSKNLKPVTLSELHAKRHKNRKDKYVKFGVYRFKSKTSNRKFRAVICKDTKAITIGYYFTFKEAYNAWKTAFLKEYNENTFHYTKN